MKSMVKHSQIICITLTLFLSSLVVCPTPQTEITYDEEPNFSALPNEVPELSSFYTRFDDVTQQNLLKLKNVIGYLPFNEQIALMKSAKGSTTNLFSFSDYDNYIQTSTGTYFDEQEKALGDYISQQEKMLSYGIGCLKAASNKYASESDYNKQMQTIIYNSIDNILNAQTNNNQCQVEFLEVLQQVSMGKKSYLFSLTKTNQVLDTANIFTYDSNNNVEEFKYQSGAESIVVTAFKKYALCQNEYTNILATSSIQAEIALSNMDKCRDYDNPNNNAGNSSDVYDNPSIAYRKNDKQKGINNGNLVRSDQKTFNGYLLDHGFNFGKAKYNNIYSVYNKYSDIINEVETDFTSSRNLLGVQGIITKIKASTSIPYSGLIADIITILVSHPFQSLTNALKNNVNVCNNEDYSIELNSDENTPLCSEDCCDTSSNECLFTTTNVNSPFTSFKLYGTCKNKQIIIVAEAEHPTLGTVFDILYNNGKTIGAQTTSTIQACMASFSSGGSNDKDACRDVITKKCGMNIDYQCKKSGFYDYINANPNSVPLPPECYNGDTPCFEWIQKYFFAGKFVVKPSAFVGFNLYLSTSVNSDSSYLDGIFYKTHSFASSNVPTESATLLKYHGSAKWKIQILGTTLSNKADISEKTVLMDKGAYKILHDGAKSINLGFTILILNIALLF